jgi:hypothetical protein
MKLAFSWQETTPMQCQTYRLIHFATRWPFWAPVPWLLEASIVLELVLHKYYEAVVIAALLIFNATLSYFQEGRAQATHSRSSSRVSRSTPLSSAMAPGRPCRRRIGLRRPGQAIAWRCGGRRCTSDRRIGSTRSIDAHGRPRAGAAFL